MTDRLELIREEKLYKLLPGKDKSDRLEASGEVERFSGDDDRRRVQVRLTASGHALAAELVAEAKAHERRITDSYSSSEIEILKDTLKNLRQKARDIHQGEDRCARYF